MLNLYRRHLKKCPHRGKAGRDWVKCACPIWCDGEAEGRRVRQTLKTRDWQRALRRMADMENPQAGGIVSKTVADAVDAFLEQKGGAQPGTLRKYKRLLGALESFARHRGLEAVSRVRLEDLDAYRNGRGVNRTRRPECSGRSIGAESFAPRRELSPSPPPAAVCGRTARQQFFRPPGSLWSFVRELAAPPGGRGATPRRRWGVAPLPRSRAPKIRESLRANIHGPRSALSRDRAVPLILIFDTG